MRFPWRSLKYPVFMFQWGTYVEQGALFTAFNAFIAGLVVVFTPSLQLQRIGTKSYRRGLYRYVFVKWFLLVNTTWIGEGWALPNKNTNGPFRVLLFRSFAIVKESLHPESPTTNDCKVDFCFWLCFFINHPIGLSNYRIIMWLSIGFWLMKHQCFTYQIIGFSKNATISPQTEVLELPSLRLSSKGRVPR